ncbi:MAG TPA: 6-carboxytetrahydropterin synthase, partial [Verrucomicrobiales bacterium]|nr:6-carboxytetrahydropterin synthase [Verrucomicrobiales bacterium]
MPYRICRIFEIENGHMLSKHPEKCRFPHGHSRRVEIVLEAEHLDSNDMVCDFKVLRRVIETYLEGLDHALCMNTQDPAFAEFRERFGERVVGYEGVDPTTEVMARGIHEALRERLESY